MLTVFFTNALICLVFNSVLYFGFPSYIYGPITFSFVFYALLAFLVFYSDSKTVIEGEKIKYNRKRIPQKEALKIEAKLQVLMTEKQLFKNPSLKLKTLAEELQISSHLLSQFLNDNLNRNFSEFINEYRVKSACQLLQEAPQFTIEGIGKEVGFRSKASFYNAFKKQFGITPSQYAKQVNLT